MPASRCVYVLVLPRVTVITRLCCVLLHVVMYVSVCVFGSWRARRRPATLLARVVFANILFEKQSLDAGLPVRCYTAARHQPAEAAAPAARLPCPAHPALGLLRSLLWRVPRRRARPTTSSLGTPPHRWLVRSSMSVPNPVGLTSTSGSSMSRRINITLLAPEVLRAPCAPVPR